MPRLAEHSIIKNLLGIIELGRPFDGLVIGSAVVLGMIVSTTAILPADKYVLGFLMGFILLAAMDTFNDYKDREVDKISKPWRAIPRGLPPGIALVTAVIETIVGLMIAFLLEIIVLITVIVAVAVAIAYSKWLKPYFLMKNVVVALGLSMAMVAGVFIAAGNFTVNIIFLLLLILIVTFCFEIQKDLGDIEGDSSHGIKTIPVVLGVQNTAFLVIAGYTLSWLLACIFFVINSYNFLHIAVLVVAAIFGLFVAYFLYKDTMKYLERTRRIVTAVIGMLILAMISLFL